MKSRALRIAAACTAFSFVAACSGAPAVANPSFSHAESGDISVIEDGALYTIHAGDRAIGAFHSFGNVAGETIRSVQASSDQTALYRVIGADPSTIYGALEANSRVFLVNPNGILFGPGSSVNAPGLVASALDMADADFLAGRYAFEGGSGGFVANRGALAASPGGYIALVGRSVENTGSVRADGGTAALAAGERVTLSLDEGGLVSVAVSSPVTAPVTDLEGNDVTAAINSAGTVAADGGVVVVSAAAAAQVFDSVVNHSGIAEARSVGGTGGTVLLSGGDAGVTRVSGSVLAVGDGAGEAGGSARVLGDLVALDAGALVDASGRSGGGEALVGGAFRGEGGVPTASRVYVDPAAAVRADAIDAGDGGTAVIWSDEITRFYGTATARGGAASGDGGLVEVSGKGLLDANGTVRADAPTGAAGTVLFDPKNITIDDSGAATPLSGADQFSDSPGSTVTIDKDTINGAGAAVVLQASNDITLAASSNILISTPSVPLTMQAGRSITLNSDVQTMGGAITLTANETSAAGVADADRDPGAATITMADGTTINAGTADITIILGTGAGNTNTTSGDITLENLTTTMGGDVYVANHGTTAGSDILRASSDALISGATAAFDVSVSSGGSVGTSAAPLRLAVANVEARGQGGGVWLDSPNTATTVGGAALGGLTGITTASNGSIGLSVNAATLTIDDAISADGTGDVTITVTSGMVMDADAALDITADVLTITAASVGGAGEGDLETETNSMHLSATAGGVFIQEATAATLSDVDANGPIVVVSDAGTLTAIDVQTTTDSDSNDITLTATAGDIVVGTVSTGGAAGDVTLNAAAGSVLDDGAATLVTADVLTINALNAAGTSGNRLDTSANTLDVSVTSAGGIYITEASALIMTMLDTANGAISLQTGGNTVLGTIASATDADANDIEVIASSGNITTGAVNAGSTAGDILLQATAGSVLSGGGTLTGDTVTITAATGIGTSGNAVNTTANTLDLSVIGAGPIFLDESGSVTLAHVETANGSITIGAAGLMTVTHVRSLTDADANDITLTNTGNIVLGTVNAGSLGDLTIGPTASLVSDDGLATLVTADVFTAMGVAQFGTAANRVDTAFNSITLMSSGEIGIAETDAITLTDVDAGNGPISISAGGTITATDVVVTTDFEANDITLTATSGDIIAGIVTAGASQADVFLTATAGSILDDGSGATKVTGQVVTLTAASGVGSSSDALETSASFLDVSVTGAGLINLADSAPAGTVLADLDTANGPITVTGTGKITVTDVASLTDSDANDITITASAGQMIVATVTAGTLGDVTLTATTNAIVDDGAGTMINGDLVTLTAASGVGTSINMLDTAAVALDVSVTGGGEIGIAEAGSVVFADIDTFNGPITLTAAGSSTASDVQSLTDSDFNDITITLSAGDLALGKVVTGGAAGDVTLTAAAGAITDANGTATNVIADVATFVTGASKDVGSATQGVEVTANTVSTGGVGGTAYINTGDVNDQPRQTSGLVITNGKIQGGESIDKFTTATSTLYQEGDAGSGDKEDEDEADSPENFGADAAVPVDAPVGEPPPAAEDVPVDEQTFNPCGVA